MGRVTFQISAINLQEVLLHVSRFSSHFCLTWAPRSTTESQEACSPGARCDKDTVLQIKWRQVILDESFNSTS